MTTSSQPESSLEDLLKQLREKIEEPISNITVKDNTVDTITLTNTGAGYSPYMYSSTGASCLTGSYTIGTSLCNTISYNNGSTISTICPSNSTINIGAIDTSTMFSWGEEWKDRFPAWDRILDMCEHYPGLKIAFEKFKTVYKLVRDDYDTPENKRPLP
jgi:hypothetical protein